MAAALSMTGAQAMRRFMVPAAVSDGRRARSWGWGSGVGGLLLAGPREAAGRSFGRSSGVLVAGGGVAAG